MAGVELMARLDPQVAAHLEWIGFVRPTGLVVSAPALVRAGVILNRRDAEGQRLLRKCVEDDGVDHGQVAPGARLGDFRAFAESVLGWSFSPKGYAGTSDAPIPDQMEVHLPEGVGTFRPDFAVRAEPLRSPLPKPVPEATEAEGDKGEPSPWQLLVSVIDNGESFDGTTAGALELSAHGRMERLLRHTGAPAGLIFNGTALRLVSAPAGENSGWLDFRVADMLQTAGRPICAAMRELLGQTRLLAMPADKRLAALLSDSRKFQNEVSERLAEQVLHALYELLRGFQAARDASRGELLGRELVDEPDEIYRGLLTVVLRLVFLLYAEERDMLPQSEVFLGAYSVSGLYERLREDAAVHPDTMDQRYGAYAQLLALWRMVHDGARGTNMSLSARHGDLFHPDRYPFLEGRGGLRGDVRQVEERIDPPLVADGTIHRVLEKLIVLDAERISYRALDVEHIGSVYETMMGFRLETAAGQSIAIKAAKKHGAPATINVEELLAEAPTKRAKWLQGRTDRKLTAVVNRAVQQIDPQAGGTIDALHAALDSVIDKNATPDLVPAGSMVLQPSEERRRSGSHYTPRELTEPIVRIALEPIFDRMQQEAGGPLRPEQILDLKVCDPAMGSGAFLVGACRQLADALIESWRTHSVAPEIPPDEDETILTRRMVAQRCLYGVDRNPKAVDLAKLSLWLTTLAKEHPLTFLDHALRHGDSLVGLSIPQLQAFHWKGDAPHFEEGFETLEGRAHLDKAAELRQLIRRADDSMDDGDLRELWDKAQSETAAVRLLGDLVIAAFFDKSKPKDREARRKELAAEVIDGESGTHRPWLDDLRRADPPLAPFHWQIEFPEVFDRDTPGFDAIVGNPPFGGHVTVVAGNLPGYTDWLRYAHSDSKGKCDVVAHFFRRSYDLIRTNGTTGLIATNTISQGDTRASGLQWICNNNGQIYSARRRVMWPGTAAVVISIVHISKGSQCDDFLLDGQAVDRITAFLFNGCGHDDPIELKANKRKSFQGGQQEEAVPVPLAR
ncbi:MAG: N-6 DNA methylase [Acidimicrobiaceae bacterium]|nr:N-6 DNA methylase [Acidimicrobiaceae bacterium]